MLQACSPPWAFLTTYFDASRVCTVYCNCVRERGVSRTREEQLYKNVLYTSISLLHGCNTSSIDGGYRYRQVLHYLFNISSGHGFCVAQQSRKNHPDDEGHNTAGLSERFSHCLIYSKRGYSFLNDGLASQKESKIRLLKVANEYHFTQTFRRSRYLLRSPF